MADLIQVETINDIRVLSLHRPEVRNALSSTVIKELAQHADDLAHSKTVRAVIITGEGEKAFCAGADLKERQGMSEMETLDFVTRIQATFQKIAELPMPTIAAMNGDAFGGGLELALACDLRVMAKDAMLGLTECSLGIIPGAGGTQRLPRLIGLSRAMELIFLARKLKADEALRIGVINHLANDAHDARTLALQIAEDIAKNAPLAIRAAKEALVASQNSTLLEGLVSERASYHEIIESDDRKEGLRAFLEKRSPQFRGQ